MIFFATPCYRSDPASAQAWASRTALKLGIHETAKAGIVWQCPWVDIARETLVSRFLETSLDWLFFRDDDVETEPDTVERAIALNHPIVVAPYRKRVDDVTVWTTRWREDGTILDAGLGCTLIRRDVFERLHDRHGELRHMQGAREQVGIFDPVYGFEGGIRRKRKDDGAFFYRARLAGFQAVALEDSRVTHAGLASHWHSRVEGEEHAE